MKLLRVLSAASVAAALAATMVMSASATSKEDVLAAAQKAGLPAGTTQYQTLSNFLDANTFTSAEYDKMIAAANGASASYLAPAVERVFPGKDISTLTADELQKVVASMTEAEKQGIRDSLVKVGTEVGVEVTANQDNAVATVKKDTDSKGTPATNVTTSAVANTGGIVAEQDANSGVIACAGLALVLAATGVVVVARKSRA